MKRGNMLLMMIIIAGIITIGQFKTSAGEIDATEDRMDVEQETSEERESSEGQETEEGYSGENTMEVTEEPENVVEDDREVKTDENDVTEDDREINPNDNDVVEDVLNGYVPGVDDKHDLTDGIELQDMEEEAPLDHLYYQGLLYYCSRYQYESEIVYLQKYLEYIKLQTAASQDMYDMGEITSADVASYQAVQVSVEAQLKVAKNQSDYNTLFLTENNLDYSSYIIKEEKDVEDTAYYLEHYPEKNHMTMAGYVTNYKNALAYMKAKKIELDSLERKQDLARLLYEAGEISKLEWKQQEAAAAKAQYELEQYYVEMNLAYVNLSLYILQR